MIEIFKDIPGYEGLYQVSNLGNVLSIAKGNGNGNRNRILKPSLHIHNHTTYCRVTTCVEGKTKAYSVHRLVAKAFIPNPEGKPHVNHIDNVGTHNWITNLEWVSHKENMKHSSDQGRQDECRALGCEAASKLNQDSTEKKFLALLGNRFIKAETKKVNNNTRRFITFNCKYCKGQFTMRSDSAPLRIRDGVCNHCKEEDIV